LQIFFLLKRELQLVVLISIILGTPTLILSETSVPQQYPLPYFFVAYGLHIGIEFVTVGFPLLQTFLPVPKVLTYGRVNNLKDVLIQPDLKKLFVQHLVKSLAFENILYYDEINSLKSEEGTKKIAKAHEIVKKFIVEGSLYEINIDYYLRKHITDIIDSNDNEALISYLIDAQQQIFRVMSDDCFPRFTQSREYKEWIEYKKNLTNILTVNNSIS